MQIEEQASILFSASCNGAVSETGLLLLPTCTESAKRKQTFSYGKEEQMAKQN